MSAFIVGVKTINRVITFVASSAKEVPVATNRLFESAGALNYDYVALGRALWALNTKAVNIRYGEKNKTAKEYRYNPQYDVATNPIQGFKSLGCLIYQCTEGEIPNTKLFKALYNFRSQYALHYVQSLKAYENAEWD